MLAVDCPRIGGMVGIEKSSTRC